MRSCRWAIRVAAVALLSGAPGVGVAASIDDLLRAYPDALAGFDGSNLVWRDGTRMAVGDGRPDTSMPDTSMPDTSMPHANMPHGNMPHGIMPATSMPATRMPARSMPARSMEEQIRNGSILDQLRLAYPVDSAPMGSGPVGSGPVGSVLPAAPQQDPGRVRNRAFFDKMYGDCRAGQVASKLVSVVWLPNTWGHIVKITSVNGVDRQLTAISRELDALPAADKKYLYPPGGTYDCRPVADTGQTSMHAWGAAIDINPALSQYWLWRSGPGRIPAYSNHIPPDVVAIFERHGFIWGGRWAHFDTMHFEYRPELLGYNPISLGQQSGKVPSRDTARP
jgi:hypothetical protein